VSASDNCPITKPKYPTKGRLATNGPCFSLEEQSIYICNNQQNERGGVDCPDSFPGTEKKSTLLMVTLGLTAEF